MYMDIWDIEIITHVAEGESMGRGGRGKGERDPRLQEAADSRATARYRVGVLSRVRIPYLRSRTHAIIRAHASTN